MNQFQKWNSKNHLPLTLSNSGWGQIWLKNSRISLYLCRDYWRIHYPYHYAQIVTNYNGTLEARNKCYEMAKILGSNYSHYCNEYCYQPYEDSDCLLNKFLNDFKEKTFLFPAKHFKEHDWSEINGHFESHYDDYFEEL